jgi:NADH:ubiquinone oxidoreductase subunit H
LTIQCKTEVLPPRAVNVILYDFAPVVVFAMKWADRATVPAMHLTVVANPAIFGLDDQVHVVTLLTLAVNFNEPPDALTVFVAALAWATTRPPRQSATLAIVTAILRFIEGS